MPPGVLYVVATPIGNLADWTYRAAKLLHEEVDVILCEDTRHTRNLLAHYGIRRPLESYHQFNESGKAEAVVERLLDGARAALISDAGAPGIADPGFRLVRLCRERSVPVVPLPGPSALIAALMVSGLPAHEFFFAGFLPARQEARRRRLETLRPYPSTLVLFEAPHRLRETLEDLEHILGDRRMFLAREMTKLHEEYLYGRISEVAAQAKERGECVLIVEGAEGVTPPPALDLEGMTRQELLKTAAERLGVSRKKLYEALYIKEEGR